MELELYRKRIEMMVRERKGTPVYNGSPDHAAIIIENLFLTAQHSVRLLSGDLNSRVYGTPDVVQRAKEFLGHSGRDLKVLLEQETFSQTHPLIEEIAASENAEVRILPAAVSSNLKYHLMAADKDCFRFEPEKGNHVAIAAFGDVESTTNLVSVFDSMWNRSAPPEKKAN